MFAQERDAISNYLVAMLFAYLRLNAKTPLFFSKGFLHYVTISYILLLQTLK